MQSIYRIKAVLAVSAVFLTTLTVAQKKQFTMAEATNGFGTTLAPKSIKSPSWQPGTDRFWQNEKKDDKEQYKVTEFGAKKLTETYVLPGTFPAEAKISGLPALHWLDKEHAWVQGGKNVVFGALSKNAWTWDKTTALPENADNIKVDKSGAIAYTIDNNLWYWDPASRTAVAVTAEKEKNILCGQAVHRNEFGIETGIFFAPTGKLLAYYRMDQTMVKDYPVIHWDTVPAQAELIKYPMAGGTSHQVQLVVFNPGTGSHTVLNIRDQEKDHYLTCVTWSPDEKSIFVAVLNRGQDHLWLEQYDAATGGFMKLLFEETNPKYVHPTHQLVFVPGNNDQFIWWSERDGYEHLYLYRTDGTLVRQLTKGEWVVNELSGFNIKDHKVIITTSKESPIEKHAYAVSLENGAMTRIDTSAGMHNIICSEDGKYVFDAYSSAMVPKMSVVWPTDLKAPTVLLASEDPLAAYDRPEVRKVMITAADGVTPLYGKLILPTHFDYTKKYPVIVYLYNGPNVQLIHNSYPESGNLWYEYMAQHGYVVFTMDGRGSWNRGLNFEQATFRNLGDVEMDDQLKGVQFLKGLRFVDTARIGVHGWSFGGFMTTSLMLKHPGVFKCAVAGGPVIDWKMYEVMYTERYMDQPQDNPLGYAKANLLDKVANLKGKLMLIHGTNDDVVVWQNSIDFIKKAVDEGVQVDYFVYPGHPHNVRGKDRVHLMQKISDYFFDHL